MVSPTRMFPTDRQALWIAGLCHLAGLLLGTISLLRERRHSRFLMYVIILAAYLLQTFGLSLRGREVGGCPLGNTFEIFQFCAWTATSLYLLIGATFRLSMLGYFTSCLAAAMTLISLAIPAWDADRSFGLAHASPLVAMHAGIAMFAYGIYAMLALTSGLLLLRHHSLRSKRLGGRFNFLPSLLELEKIGFRLLLAGTLTLFAALCVGYFNLRISTSLVNNSKLVAVVGLFACYSIVLGLRLLGRLVGSKLAWVCMLLYILALFSLWPVDRSRNAPHPLREPPVSSP